MRLWSLHPSYLDAKGLVALWREALLARKVLQGQTRGYRNHPQLIRFRAQEEPINSIECYLWAVVDESLLRGYHFDASKLVERSHCEPMPVTKGQLEYELAHLQSKLKLRDPAQLAKINSIKTLKTHPIFKIIPGNIEPWEKVEKNLLGES